MGSEKLYQYEGILGWLHGLRENYCEKILTWKEKNPEGFQGFIKSCFKLNKRNLNEGNENCDDFSHIYRKKTRKELIRVSAAVMGIEFSYAAETAFVSPTLLKIGVEHKHMTLVWALSPLIGFFLTPILGSLSDRCRMKLGRRRPFILVMSLGVLFGLILVPNGEKLGYLMGDLIYNNVTSNLAEISPHRTSTFLQSDVIKRHDYNDTSSIIEDFSYSGNNSHPWGIFFTILGTVLLDFDADACQSPARAYLLDVTVPDDHAKGLSTFTIMAGLGGFFGYALGGINWDVTFIGILLGGHVRAVFTLISIIFVICVTYTISSFKEMPLDVLESPNPETESIKLQNQNSATEKDNIKIVSKDSNYGSLIEDNSDQIISTSSLNLTLNEENLQSRKNSINSSPNASFLLYLKSIIYMPHSIRMLCLTNLFCWMAHVCYSLYFTDFVGEAVFHGNPTARDGDYSRELYEDGIRFGCWGMSMYSLSCACYSMIIEKLITKFGARSVYIGGLLIYSSGMFLMAVTKHKIGVILFSWTAGVMYSTLFTMPYLLIAHYHARGTFEMTEDGQEKIGQQIRGLGTDVAIISSMVFLAQFVLSICMGSIVSLSGTTTAVVSVASALAFCGAISATQVMYLDL